MITTRSNLSIGPLATRAPRRRMDASTLAELGAQIAEANRLIRQYPGRRQSPAARINVKAIYADRTTGIRAALPKDRSQQFCGETCYTERNGDASTCDGMASCWAKSIGASSRLTSAAVYAQRRLDLERGRVPAPRPRSLHDVMRDHYRSRA